MIIKCNDVKEGVRTLLTQRLYDVPKYDIIPRGDGFAETVDTGAVTFPLHFWRYNAKIVRMHEYAEKDVASVCCVNVYSFTSVDDTLRQHIYRELDIAEYLLCSKVKKVTAFITGKACNLIAVMHSGATANLELGASMASGSVNQCQHKLLTTHGMANDRAVDTMLVQPAVSVFSDDPRPYTYTDFETLTYGLCPDDIERVHCLFNIFKGADSMEELIEQGAHLERVVDAVYKSAELGQTCEVEE